MSEAARQKIVETERLRATLAELVPADKLDEWTRTSSPAFEGQTPIQVMERGEADRQETHTNGRHGPGTRQI